MLCCIYSLRLSTTFSYPYTPSYRPASRKFFLHQGLGRDSLVFSGIVSHLSHSSRHNTLPQISTPTVTDNTGSVHDPKFHRISPLFCTSTSSIQMGDILPEVLDRIFELCERQHRQMPHWPVFSPKSRLQPLLLVCKKWHSVAERRLYTSVSLGSDRTVKDRNGKKMMIKGKDVCRRFLETVQNNAPIASIVRELRMGSLRNLAQDGEESQMHIRLIAVCKNVEKISLYGCDPSALDKMVETLVNTDLLTLEFTSEQLGGYLGYEWFVPSPRTLVDLLCRWPRLQKMRVKMTGGEFDVSLPKVPVIPGFCVALKEVDARDSTFDAAQLSRLLDLSPALEDLSITVEKDCGPVLRRSIQAWSSSLKACTFSSHRNHSPRTIATPSYNIHCPSYASWTCLFRCSPSMPWHIFRN
ncbi:hypothetical protein SCHPADRAFT_580589 [Schizopora paradoxa]|uniref:F-box domain-containing protein n=1 Tax=Schizopora paradoxa TaxID=27342 RepID=A0A0H2RBB4_9AGAM|nr:hypothetical protein SCHPADRAFT_580589 [Schizopora paradoxa]